MKPPIETTNRKCLAYEPRERGFAFEEEKPVPVIYDELQMDCGFRTDFLVNRIVVVELKAKSTIHPIDEAQTLSHIRLLKLLKGLLVNFHEVKLVDGVRGIMTGYESMQE